MAPYEDPRRSPAERVADLVPRLSLEEKVGLMFQTVIESGPDGTLLETPGAISKSPTSTVVLGKHMNHFNVHALASARNAARWSNALQLLAADTPHGIPVTVSTDPRHAFTENSGLSFSAGPFSQWPESMGLAALDDVETIERFARIARDEYRAVGIRAALHPQIDLATEPRWGRQLQTFGSDTDRVVAYTRAYLRGFQGETLGPDSVACTTKHFPGGGPQLDGEDAHFPYGREQVYPGGMFAEHLRPFRAAIEQQTAAIMPYYGMPHGLVLDGEPVEEVGFGYNRRILQGLLRDELGYDGVIVTDWELVNDNVVGSQVLPARAWGVEHLDAAGRMRKILDAGADQFGGEECTDLLLDLVRSGQVSEQRIDESAARLLLVKFQLGLFDDPYVDEDAAEAIVGSTVSRAAGASAQARSVTVLENRDLGGTPVLPLRAGSALWLEGVAPEAVPDGYTVVDDPDRADLAIVRLAAPFDPRDDLFLEAYFHQGSLEFRPGLVARLRALAARVPLVVDVALDRPAVLTPIAEASTALSVTFGVSDDALLRALTGVTPPEGRLPVEVPRTMDAVRRSKADVPNDTVDPLFRVGSGLRLRVPIPERR
ncbi:glycoside hydrolase family 3 N-terminal domain-containing protein [Curtobacterium sp. BRB10]|nr:glycoside hydrolase family 3 N-terminal domain-containing protein [Curtobacterium sp. BRB10]MDT0234852.1 glycoside hydrolase family 3 N-terminal domain-containing protein [Curtobacterium sp. BRB10]